MFNGGRKRRIPLHTLPLLEKWIVVSPTPSLTPLVDERPAIST